MEEYNEIYEEMEDNYLGKITSEGTKIITKITVNGETFYMDEKRNVFEKLNSFYYIVTSKRIIDAVEDVLKKRSDNFMIE